MLEGKRPSKDQVLVEHGPWSILLDTYVVSTGQVTVVLTRVRAYFAGRRGLRLTVRRRNLFDRIFNALGWGEGPPQARALSGRYVVRAKPKTHLSSLFSGTALTEAILGLPSMRLEVRKTSRKSQKRYGQNSGVVVCQTTGVITDPDRLVGMVNVVRETLDALARVGEASREPQKW